MLCAVDEVAVDLFLSQRIKFTEIAHLVEQILEQHQNIAHPTLEDIKMADNWARDEVLNIVKSRKPC